MDDFGNWFKTQDWEYHCEEFFFSTSVYGGFAEESLPCLYWREDI